VDGLDWIVLAIVDSVLGGVVFDISYGDQRWCELSYCSIVSFGDFGSV
jgi:hypothetical protein